MDIKNRKALIVGGGIVILFVVIFYIIGSNNNSVQTTSNSNQQQSLCSDITSLKNYATVVDFKELKKDPDSFKGKVVKFTGKILQIQESNNYGIIRLAVTQESYGWSISDIIYVEYQNHTDAVEDDIVTVYGQLTGSETYKSQANFNITIPSMMACLVEKGTGKPVNTNQPITNSVPQKATTTNQTKTQTQTTQPIQQQSVKPNVPALSVSCSVLQTSLSVGQTTVWTVQSSGGTGSYIYTWSGTDGLSGNNQSISKSYSSAGTKNASVNVISGDQSINQSCSNSASVARPAPSPINISGTGQQASQKFNLEQGLSIFTMQNSGQSNFIVQLLDSNGNTIGTLANEIGNFSGSKALNIANDGSYLFNVDSDGPWSITITQPRPISAPPMSAFNGHGPQATAFFTLSQGLHTFSFTHDGSSNFIVQLLDQNGNEIENLVNEIGNYSGSKAVHIDSSAIYFLNIYADGNWTVSIQ